HFCLLLNFFFQAEDGIRYRNVTGVQTCALPILNCFLTPSHISPARFTNLVFKLRTLVSILPTKEFSILFLMLFMKVVNLFFTLSHIVEMLFRKFLEKFIMLVMIFPTKLSL